MVASDVVQGGVLATGRFWANMILDPLDCMARLGIARSTARVMRVGRDGARRRQFLYLTGTRLVAPVLLDPEGFRTSNVPRRAHGGGAQARLRRGLIGSQDAEHKHYRAVFQAATGMSMQAEFAASVGRQVAGVLRDTPDDRPTDLAAHCNDLVLRHSIIGMYQEADITEALAIGRAIVRWIDLAYAPATLAFPVRLPGTPYARFMQSAEALEAAILRWTAARSGMDPQRDLLSRFVNGPDEHGQALSPERLVGQIATLVAASFSSSAAALTWTLFLLMQNPKIAHAVCDEIEGSGFDPLAAAERALDLPLLDQVCSESMRLFTPVPYQMRRVIGDRVVAGIPVRRDDVVVLGCWAHNRLAEVFSEPAAFRPERWADGRHGGFDSLTFSGGPRRCVGFNLAMIMIKVTLAGILATRRPRLVRGTRIDMRVAITLRARAPIPVVMARRDADFERVPVHGSVTRLYDQVA